MVKRYAHFAPEQLRTADMNHRILQPPRNLTVAVECSATQGHAKQRSYIFVYT